MKTLLLMQMGDVPDQICKVTGNFDQMFLRAADYSGLGVKIVHAARGEEPGSHFAYAGVIVSGSPAMVSDREEWSEKSGRWLVAALRAGIPILGVCYGHQLLAQALGGRVDFHPDGMELGTHQVTLTEAGRAHPLLAELPAFFQGNMSHSQTVTCLPDSAVLLAYSAHDAHQIVAYGERALSLQFHPEFNVAAMQAYVSHKSGQSSSPCPMRLGTPVLDTPLAASVLQRFVDSCK